MPNLEVAIAEAKLWDILNRDVVQRLAATATPERSVENAHALLAAELMRCNPPEPRFLDLAQDFIHGDPPAIRKQVVALAKALGADYERLMGYLKVKKVISRGLPIYD